MQDVFYEHGINKDGCCIGMRGNVDNDPNDQVDISDINFMIDYLFTSGPTPVCHDEANVDGDAQGIVDMSDLYALIDFFFNHGTIPSCP